MRGDVIIWWDGMNERFFCGREGGDWLRMTGLWK